jgi:putative flippase GtrA
MKNMKLKRELLSYIVAGAFTTLVNFAVYYLLIFLSIEYKIANTAAFIVSVLFAFIVNKKYVFLSENGYIGEFIKFSAGRIFTYMLDIGSMILLIEFLSVGEYAAKVWTNILVIAANYFISKFWTFR